MENYYDIIGVSYNASEEEIKEKIIAEINKWRKRVNAPNPQKQREASERLEILQEAEAILLNPGKRMDYDLEFLEQQNAQPNTQHQTQHNTHHSQSQPVDESTSEDSYRAELENRFSFYFDQGNFAEAIAACQELTRLEPQNPIFWHNLALSNFNWGNYPESRYEITHAISLQQTDAHFYHTAYVIYYDAPDLNDTERRKSARNYINKALSIEPNNVLYNTASARLYYHINQYQKAINILEQLKENGNLTEDGEEMLALSYVSKVQNEYATRVDYTDGSHQYFFTSRELIGQAKDIMQNAFSFAKTPDAKNSINQMNMLADESLKSEYHYKFLLLLVICALWFITALDSFSIIWMAVSGALVYFSWKKFRVPVYMKNQKYINSLNKK